MGLHNKVKENKRSIRMTYKFSIRNHLFDVVFSAIVLLIPVITAFLSQFYYFKELHDWLLPLFVMQIINLPFCYLSIQYYGIDKDKKVELNFAQNFLIISRKNESVKVLFKDIIKVEAHGNRPRTIPIVSGLYYGLIYTRDQGVFLVSCYTLPEHCGLSTYDVLYHFPFVSSKLKARVRF